MFEPETKFLIVDDFGTMRKIVRKVLSEIGFKNVEEADDGNTALPKLKQGAESGVPFHFVISDWNMPGMSGLELLKACRSDDKLKNLPFVMVTAESEQSNLVAAIQAGVTDYVVKPFNAATLKEKIENAYKKTQK